ncbi:MAG: nucleoside phosphorylase [Geobacteraceae bacterium]
MKQDRIGIVMAMQEEIRPILRRLGSYRKERLAGFPVYRFQMKERQISLIESGMGTKKAKAATDALVSHDKPRLLISAGFSGAVREGLVVGDLVIAEQSLSLDNGVTSNVAVFENESLLRTLTASCADQPFRIARGTTVTTRGIVAKRSADQLLSKEVANPVLDMETSVVAETAAAKGIPLVIVRAISDAAGEELLFSLDEITDRELNIRIGKVLLAIAKNPRILPQMLRLAKYATLAGNNLAVVMERLVPLV